MKREPHITLPIKKPAKVDQPEPRWRFSITYLLFALLILWVWQDLFYQMSVRTIPYSEFKAYLARHEVASAVVKQDEIDGRIVPSATSTTKNQTAEPSPTMAPSSGNQTSRSNPTAVPSTEAHQPAGETKPSSSGPSGLRILI